MLHLSLTTTFSEFIQCSMVILIKIVIISELYMKVVSGTLGKKVFMGIHRVLVKSRGNVHSFILVHSLLKLCTGLKHYSHVKMQFRYQTIQNGGAKVSNLDKITELLDTLRQ